MTRTCRSSRLLLACIETFSCAGLLASSAVAQTASARIPTLSRLKPDYLARVHQEVAAFALERTPVSLTTGFHDYRCVIHAHSYLSHDSRGTIAEIAAAARAKHIDAVFLTNHPKTDLDVVTAGQTEPVDGILFAAGAEANGFLLFPADGKLPPLTLTDQALIDAVTGKGGLAFVAHPEEHKDWSLRNLTGMEIYNTHADFMDEKELLATLVPKSPERYGALFKLVNAFRAYPQEAFAALFDEPLDNLAHYDGIARSRPFAAIAANDSHQNTGFILIGAAAGKIRIESPLGELFATLDTAKSPMLRALFGDPVDGKELKRYILDPYPVSFGYLSTHVLARERTVSSIVDCLKRARTYVAFDWIADPTGLAFVVSGSRTPVGSSPTIGDTVRYVAGLELRAELPLSATLVLRRDGTEIARTVGRTIGAQVPGPGAYRLEAYLPVGGEARTWVYTGAIRVE